jgi:hypothetical protein
MTYPFSVDDVVVSSSGARVKVWEFYDDSPETFGGQCLDTGEVSGCWEISKFKKEVSLKRKWDKSFYTTGAVYRMLKTKRINAETAIRLLIERAKVNNHTAKATVELWLRHPLRDQS